MSIDQKIKTVSDLLNENATQLAGLLPKVVTPNRFMNLCINVLQNDTKLHVCTATSLIRCIFQAAQMGLTPGLRRQVYLVPYNNSALKVVEAQLQIGYQGLLTLARRSGQVSKIDAGHSMQEDIFEFSNGFDVVLRHVPSSKFWRESWKDAYVGEGDKRHLAQDKAWEHIEYVYAFAKLTNGEKHLKVMTKEEIEWHRDRYSKAAHKGPWVDNIIEMGQKTALRELCNLLPSDEEDNLLGKAVALDRQLEDGTPQTIEVTGFVIPDDLDKQTSQTSSSGGNGKAAEPEKVEAPKLPNLGKYKNMPIDSPDVPVDEGGQGLVWYLRLKQDDLGKPGRERWDADDRLMIAALQKEIERRKGLAASAGGSASTSATVAGDKPAQESKPAEKSKPAESKAAPKTEEKPAAAPESTIAQPTWEQWQAFVDKSSLGADVAIWSKTKKEFKAKTAGDVPEDKRGAFMKRFQEIKASLASA